MTVKEITDQVILLIQRPITISYARKYINEALKILGSKYNTACAIDSVTIDCPDTSVSYTLPSNCISIIKINDGYSSYSVRNNLINFDDIGTYLITYYRLPGLTHKEVYDIKIGDDIPEVNEIFHIAIAYYVASKILLNDPTKDNINMAGIYMQSFEDMSKDSNIKKNKTKIARRLKAPLWR